MNENSDELLRARQAVARARVSLTKAAAVADEFERGFTLAQPGAMAEVLRDEFYVARLRQAEAQGDLDHARAVVAAMVPLRGTLTEVALSLGDVEVRRSAVSHWLATSASRLLPAGFRRDYEELFQAELFELAQGGLGRWRQVAHSLRVLVRVPSLRWALRAEAAPRRERSW